MQRSGAWLIALTLASVSVLVTACADDDQDDKRMTTQSAYPNRLTDATSPYLLPHAHNPVDWHEWGPEALTKARREDKPIFLSIGYSACHWCHVMAHESFENEQIAALMNEYFVNIKVDREERPDLDQTYMQATMIINQGHGGWPMSVWLTPDLKPFFAGAYFPPESKWGRPGFREVCERISELWQSRRQQIEADADRLAGLVARGLQGGGDAETRLTLGAIGRTVSTLAAAFDRERGGIVSGGTNKFPPSMALDLFLRALARDATDEPAQKELRQLVELTLDRMARGGIYDQLGGGVHRYSTDADWLVPHFEKMLYDQALVSRTYIDAYRLTGETRYARVAREVFDHVIDDLQSPDGGFYSTRDADSEGQEGKYYVWTKAEILAVLGEEDGELFCCYYGVSASGNWNDPHAPGVAKNILHVPRDLETVAQLNNVDPHELERRLGNARRKLLELRRRRAPPGLDDKILTEWNGLMIASLPRGGAVLGEKRYVDARAGAADFILDKQHTDGRLQRAYRAGRTLDAAFLTDYACMIDGLIELYEATFERRWLDKAVELNRAVVGRFYDEESGGFFFMADERTQTLLQQINRTYLPNRALLLANPKDTFNTVASPLLQNRGQIDGQPTVYVCRNYACQLPVTTAAELAKQLTQQ
jgi:uncharacterized protein YyaL (SSP411 family)